VNQTSTRTNRLLTAQARAPGKIILSGEQFVVLGAPAVAMAINLYSKAKVRSNPYKGVQVEVNVPTRFLSKTDPHPLNSQEFLRPLRIAAEATLDHIGKRRQGIDVNVDCEIPIAAGLGSSASTTVSIMSAVSKSQGTDLSRKEIFKLAFVPERYLHGKPSGVDQATCIYGGTIEFTRPASIKPIRVQYEPILLLCDSGIHHETKTLVGSVVKRSQTNRKIFRDYLSQVREISQGVSKALRSGDSEDLGSLMSLNHELLRKIGVSHPKLDRLVNTAKRAGALGAKLTGAGGGGCVVVVCTTLRSRERIAKVFRREGGTPYKITKDTAGVDSTAPS
jgi:mevalonate kinase